MAPGKVYVCSELQKAVFKALYLSEIKKNLAFRALRAHLLFQHLIVALSVSIYSLYSIKQKLKKICGFHNII